jgi:hypothetical protein
VWEFVSVNLDDIYNKETLAEILVFLRNSLLTASQANSQHSLSLLESLRKFRIPQSLERISSQ